MMENERDETLETERSEEEEEEEDYSEEEGLIQLQQMAQKIRHYRSTIPERIQNSFSSLLTAQRPILSPSPAQFSQPHGNSTDPNSDTSDKAESSKATLLAEVDSETTEKLNLLKHKISNNISAMPTLFKRLNDCISMFDKLDTYNVSIHPVLKRKRTG